MAENTESLEETWEAPPAIHDFGLIRVPKMGTGCRVCDAILSAYFRPVHQIAHFYVGTVEYVLSRTCNNHSDWFHGQIGDWVDRGQGDEKVSIVKAPVASHFQIIVGITFIDGKFELAQEPEVMESGPRGLLESIARNMDPSTCFRRGRVLDKDWIEWKTVSGWYQMCKKHHGAACHEPPVRSHLDGRPRYLIDVLDSCIVQVDPVFEYIALSYVWGSTESVKLTKGTLQRFQERGSLRTEDVVENTPLTIKHAMDLTRLLGVRYLWVDALCIVQDEEDDVKARELNRMGDIYLNAYLTIVAADGDHADYGLHGLQEVSLPSKRSCKQEVYSLGDIGKVTRRIFSSESESERAVYYQRAWTFQEYLFSRRRLVFEKGSVVWKCCSTTEFEDVDSSNSSLFKRSGNPNAEVAFFQNKPPDLSRLSETISKFNQRQLTYEQDRLPAFSGFATAMSLNFVGGFLCGLPELFFDIALLWRPAYVMKRRRNTNKESELVSRHTALLPSWSWAGWAGPIDALSWDGGMEFIKYGTGGAATSREAIPITTWYTGDSVKSTARRKVAAQWYAFKQGYQDPNIQPPESWTKHPLHEFTYEDPQHYPPPNGLGAFYFTHNTNPGIQFWYPIPLSEGKPTPMSSTPFLFANVETARLYTREIPLVSPFPSITIESRDGERAGIIHPHCRSDLSEDTSPKMQPLELVAISRGTIRNSNRIDHRYFEEWHRKLGPQDGSLYEFYNVLWVSEHNGISYRRGIGRVSRDMWEREERRRVDLILG